MDDKEEEQFEKWWATITEFDESEKRIARLAWLAGFELGHEQGRESGLADGNEAGHWTASAIFGE